MKAYRPTPPDHCLPSLDGPAMVLPSVKATILAVDPAETSGWAVYQSGLEQADFVEWGSCDISSSREPERAIELAIQTARESVTPLVMVTEHSKQAYGGMNGRFGVDGFIGMLRAQGVWRRTYTLLLSEARDKGLDFKSGRKGGLTTRIQGVVSNKWRTDLFGTTRYKDPSTGKTMSLQRPHWKYLAVKTVSEMGASLDVVTEDAAEAVLIGLWATRMAKV